MISKPGYKVLTGFELPEADRKLLLTSCPDWHIVPPLNEKLAVGPDESHYSSGRLPSLLLQDSPASSQGLRKLKL